MIGHIHSTESFGTVDGPGIRLVVFTKGCPMRCLYCHNPDTWESSGGTDMSADEILAQYEKEKGFYKNGGITVTGGEPLLQIDFVTELFEKAKEKGIHTCLDTSGVTFQPDNHGLLKKMDRLIQSTDLVMLDIKQIDPEKHQKLCSQPLKPILAFAKYLDEKQTDIWIRHVVVPGYTDDEQDLYKLGEFIGTLKHVKALDVLPYHDMGKIKYEKMKMPYPLADVEPLPKEKAIDAKNIILKGIRASKLAKAN